MHSAANMSYALPPRYPRTSSEHSELANLDQLACTEAMALLL